MKPTKKKLTLAQPVRYKIRVQGYLDNSWSDWTETMMITLEQEEGDFPPVTAITGTVDQAALQGLLRRLYALGLPLVSVNIMEE